MDQGITSCFHVLKSRNFGFENEMVVIRRHPNFSEEKADCLRRQDASLFQEKCPFCAKKSMPCTEKYLFVGRKYFAHEKEVFVCCEESISALGFKILMGRIKVVSFKEQLSRGDNILIIRVHVEGFNVHFPHQDKFLMARTKVEGSHGQLSHQDKNLSFQRKRISCLTNKRLQLVKKLSNVSNGLLQVQNRQAVVKILSPADQEKSKARNSAHAAHRCVQKNDVCPADEKLTSLRARHLMTSNRFFASAGDCVRPNEFFEQMNFACGYACIVGAHCTGESCEKRVYFTQKCFDEFLKCIELPQVFLACLYRAGGLEVGSRPRLWSSSDLKTRIRNILRIGAKIEFLYSGLISEPRKMPLASAKCRFNIEDTSSMTANQCSLRNRVSTSEQIESTPSTLEILPEVNNSLVLIAHNERILQSLITHVCSPVENLLNLQDKNTSDEALPPEEGSLPAEKSSIRVIEDSLETGKVSLPAEQSSIHAEKCSLLTEKCSLLAGNCSQPAGNCSLPHENCSLPHENCSLPHENCFVTTENCSSPFGSCSMPSGKRACAHIAAPRETKSKKWAGPSGRLVVVALLALLVNFSAALPAVIRIGAIFTEQQRDSSTELAFKYAVYRINKDKSVLPNTTLVYDIQYVPADDSFHTAKKACKQISFGVQAMFGPFDPVLGSHIQSITDALDIPHLESRLDLEPQEKEFSINLFPSHLYLNQAYKDMIKFLKWTKVAIVYEEDIGLMKLQDIIRSPPSKNVEVYIRQGSPNTYRDVLKEVKHKQIYSIIVDTVPEHMHLFLRCLLQLQMNDYRYHYLFTTFDIETFDLEDFKYNYVNMTAFRIVDADNPLVLDVLGSMESFQPVGHPILNRSAVIKAEPALVYDSVNVFAKGLHALERSATLDIANLSCDSETPWEDGSSLFNYINTVEYDGITGPIKFLEGKRSNFKLDVLKLRCEEIHKVGQWTPETGINITDRQAFFEGGKPNITLKVITVEEAPFVMVKADGNLTGNSRYEGFCVDLLKRISFMVGFEYDIDISEEGVYGVIDMNTGEWNGLVRGLMDRKADLAVGSMTINYARESVIDFTKPFMNLGISILFKVPSRQPTRLFSFMNPLAVEIWLYVLAAYVLVSFTMFVMARFSPYEWNEPNVCHDEPAMVENQFNLNNTFWFITGTLLRQGSGLNPKAASTRIVGGIWWFFTLIIISSYTANLAAFLTVERMITPIESAEDLAAQNVIEYGTLEGGSTMAFFRDSKIETYQKMWRFMEGRKPSVFVPTIEDGVERVLQGNYAFLMESTMLDYTIQRNCNLTQIGGLLNSNSYGIATPMGSPWRDKISLAILELQEKGVIQMLYSKWWRNTGDICNRDDKTKDSKANALGVENIGGVFVVLLCGLALAIVVAIVEFCWNSRKNVHSERTRSPPGCPHYVATPTHQPRSWSDDEDDGDGATKQQSLCLEMADELRFALKCRGSKQRPALRRSCTKCNAPNTTHVPTTNDVPRTTDVSGTAPQSVLSDDTASNDNNQDSSISGLPAYDHSNLQLTFYHPQQQTGFPANGVRRLFPYEHTSQPRVSHHQYQYSHHHSHQQLHQFQSSTSPLNSSPTSSPPHVAQWNRRCLSLKALAPVSLSPTNVVPSLNPSSAVKTTDSTSPIKLNSLPSPPNLIQQPLLHHHQLLYQQHLLQQSSQHGSHVQLRPQSTRPHIYFSPSTISTLPLPSNKPSMPPLPPAESLTSMNPTQSPLTCS